MPNAAAAASVDKPEPGVPPAHVPILQLVRYFLRLGTLGFGGPMALCGLMRFR